MSCPTGYFFQGFVGVGTFLDFVHEFAQVHKFITAYFVVLVEGERFDVTFGHFEVTGTFGEGAVEGTRLAAETFAQVFEAGAYHEAAFGEGRLRTAVNDLQEQFAHGGVDGVAYEVGVKGFENGLAGENFRCHGGRVGHARATDGLDEGFLYDTVFYVKRQFASALLGSAPAHTVGQTRDIDDFFGFHPFSFFGNRCGTVVGALFYNTHVFYFL